MTQENKEILTKRLKSFVWRMGAILLIGFLNFLAQNLGLLGLSVQVQVVLGLMLGELTKYLNSKSVNS